MMETGVTEREHLLERSSGEPHELSSLSDHAREEPEAETSSKTLSDTKRKLLGCSLALVCVVCNTAGLVAVQLLNQTIPHSELNGLRFLATLVVCAGYSAVTRSCDIRAEKDERGWVLLIALTATVISYSTYGKVYYLPVGTSNGVNLSLEVILNNIIGCVIHKSARWNELLASITCIIGVLLTAQPTFLFHHIGAAIIHSNATCETPCTNRHDLDGRFLLKNHTNATDFVSMSDSEEKTRQTITGYILCAVEAAASVLYFNVIRYRLPSLNSTSIVFWIAVVGAVTSFALMGGMENPTFPNIPQCTLLLATHMIAAGLSTFVYVRTSQLISPVWMALFGMLKLPLLFTLQYTVLTGLYPGYGNMAEVLGAAIILVGNVVLPITELAWYQSEKS